MVWQKISLLEYVDKMSTYPLSYDVERISLVDESCTEDWFFREKRYMESSKEMMSSYRRHIAHCVGNAYLCSNGERKIFSDLLTKYLLGYVVYHVKRIRKENPYNYKEGAMLMAEFEDEIKDVILPHDLSLSKVEPREAKLGYKWFVTLVQQCETIVEKYINLLTNL